MTHWKVVDDAVENGSIYKTDLQTLLLWQSDLHKVLVGAQEGMRTKLKSLLLIVEQQIIQTRKDIAGSARDARDQIRHTETLAVAKKALDISEESNVIARRANKWASLAVFTSILLAVISFLVSQWLRNNEAATLPPAKGYPEPLRLISNRPAPAAPLWTNTEPAGSTNPPQQAPKQ